MIANRVVEADHLLFCLRLDTDCTSSKAYHCIICALNHLPWPEEQSEIFFHKMFIRRSMTIFLYFLDKELIAH